jgi:hypothetical protein
LKVKSGEWLLVLGPGCGCLCAEWVCVRVAASPGRPQELSRARVSCGFPVQPRASWRRAGKPELPRRGGGWADLAGPGMTPALLCPPPGVVRGGGGCGSGAPRGQARSPGARDARRTASRPWRPPAHLVTSPSRPAGEVRKALGSCPPSRAAGTLEALLGLGNAGGLRRPLYRPPPPSRTYLKGVGVTPWSGLSLGAGIAQ